MGANGTHKTTSIDALREHIDFAKSRLSHEKTDILTIFPLPDDFSREEYAFAYLRAERLGMRAINRKLATISWLPMQLDPESETLGDGRAAMKKWLNAAGPIQPDSEIFGNDFMHALTRAGMGHGWEDAHFTKLSTRVAGLFRDLSCLIGIVYYVTWLAEHGIREIPLTNPSNLTRTAQDIAAFMQSPELYEQMHTRDPDLAGQLANSNDDEGLGDYDDEAPPRMHKNGASLRKADRSHLRLITNPAMTPAGLSSESDTLQ